MSWLSGLAIDLAPLRESRDFRLLWTGQAISNLGHQITTVAVPFQVYVLTGSTLAVGVLGIVQVVPYIAVSLFAGALADRVDRRRVLLFAQIGLTAMSMLLMLGALQGHPPLAFLYAVAAAASAISAVDLPARGAIVPNIVSRRRLAGALSLNFAQFQATIVAGPAIGGVLIARFGLAPGYAIDVVTFAAAIAAALMIAPQRPEGGPHEAPIVAVARGMQFLWKKRPILGGFVADINAMLFGMPRAVFPVLAVSTYHGGATALGLLYAALGTGSVVGAVGSGFVGRIKRLGRAIIICVVIWGVAITLFGLSSFSLWLGLLLLAVAGGADAISAICRGTLLQTLTPDRLRGRLSATNSMVVVGGPYLGDFRAGWVASATSAEFSLVSGGVICVVLCGVILLLFPELNRALEGPPPGEPFPDRVPVGDGRLT